MARVGVRAHEPGDLYVQTRCRAWRLSQAEAARARAGLLTTDENTTLVTASSAKEGRQLLAVARDSRLWAAYELAVRIGLRRGEVLGLRWSDVDLHEGVLTVRSRLIHPHSPVRSN
ncbi:tyrosine-type recombinase/integrase [Streptomyces broussonetiae]|uniref:tyrosine-type recombinase/integrase n=1 Tax=Streptomyces broussonetiae TaxID=2686304 RepID=UPI001E2CF5F1|nr:tyrosine-type recombinase/integrase [Streptomyces broussonetiae]